MAQEDDGSVRIEVLQRLAEQAMSDSTFREEANENLETTLTRYGYELRPQELALVMRFRRSLADAGVDLDLVSSMGEAQLMALFENLPRRVRRAEGA
ncbi:MAG: hypothetical protein R2853_14460 [Thermomicrobiales bacterium]|nr:hypothetical protein [Thermomicrobiales bacterium]